jgi:hypothetical protein
MDMEVTQYGTVSPENRLYLYSFELDAIRTRFKETSEGLSLLSEDDDRMREIVLELKDLFHDHLPSEDYADQTISAYNEGISNFYEKSSYASVKRIMGIVKAAIVRLQK